MARTFGLDLAITANSTEPFHAELAGYTSSALRIARFRFPAHVTLVTRRNGAAPNILISLHQAGRVRVQQDGRQCEVGPGQMFMVDASRPLRIETSTMETHALVVSAAIMRQAMPSLDLMTARAVEIRTGAGAICKAFVNDLIARHEALDDKEADALAAAIPHMVSAAFVMAIKQNQSSPCRPSSNRKKINDYIERELANPALTIGMIAAATGLSKRYLHVLFSETGETVMAFIWRLRLERTRSQLASPSMRHHSIGDIAMSWGFKHLGSFSRMFHNKYGLSPREFRRSKASAAPEL